MILTFLKAYDSHCNLVLGDVEETIYVVDEDDEDEESVKVARACFPASSPALLTWFQTISKKSEMLFVRGKKHSYQPPWCISNLHMCPSVRYKDADPLLRR